MLHKEELKSGTNLSKSTVPQNAAALHTTVFRYLQKTSGGIAPTPLPGRGLTLFLSKFQKYLLSLLYSTYFNHVIITSTRITTACLVEIVVRLNKEINK